MRAVEVGLVDPTDRGHVVAVNAGHESTDWAAGSVRTEALAWLGVPARLAGYFQQRGERRRRRSLARKRQDQQNAGRQQGVGVGVCGDCQSTHFLAC